MDAEKKDELTSDKLTDYHGRYVAFGQVHEFLHGRGSVNMPAQFAMELLKADAQAGQLGYGIASGKAAMAASVAQAWFDECKRRGWILELPPLDDSDRRSFTSPALAQMAMAQPQGRRQ